MGQRTDRLWWLAVALMVSACLRRQYDNATTVSTLSGDWGISRSRQPPARLAAVRLQCRAPGRGRARVTQNGMSFDGQLLIFNSPRGRCTERSPTATSSRCG